MIYAELGLLINLATDESTYLKVSYELYLHFGYLDITNSRWFFGMQNSNFEHSIPARGPIVTFCETAPD